MLLILAGITITYVLGEDGIIAQAKLAAEKTRIANYQTVLEMIRASLEPEKVLEELTTEEFLNRYEEMAKKEAENGALKGSTITGPQEDTKDKVRVQTKEGDVFEITEEGVEYKGNLSTNEILTSSITVSPTTAEIRVDGTVKLTATIEPSNATNKELTWTSDQTEIAKVIVNADGTATVTGKSAGKANITVTAQDSTKKSATCTVTVKAKGNEIAQQYGIKQGSNKQVSDGEKSMWIPTGFTILNPEEYNDIDYQDNDNPKINEGVVVRDPQGNEFVWVPVDINTMVYCQEHYNNGIISYNKDENKLVCDQCENGATTNFAGKLYASDKGNSFNEDTPNTGYNTGASSYTGIREPDTIQELDIFGDGSSVFYGDENTDNLAIVLEGNGEKTEQKFKEQLQTEFNKMATSVGKYKGFYIGRYETSNLSNTGNTYSAVNQGQVVKGASSINNGDWYRQYVSNKKIGSNYTDVATTSMIWGCQWDQVMLWMKDIDNTEKPGVKYIKDSTGKGNYLSTVATTGSNPTYEVKKIYDMAGNVEEWTIEAFGGSFRVPRGVNNNVNEHTGSNGPASYRSYDPPTGTPSTGSRSTLYVNP